MEKNNLTCPYCNKILNKEPKRKTKCPFCKNEIYVRSKQTIFASKLLQKGDALAVDSLDNLEYRGITKNDFFDKKIKLSKQFGQEAESTDVIWALYNDLIARNLNNLNLLKGIYYEMALFLNKEGKDCLKMLQLSNEMELRYFRHFSFIKKVQIITCGEDSCEACRKLHNKVFTIDEALKTMPIPCKECTHKIYDKKHGFCRCCYASMPE